MAKATIKSSRGAVITVEGSEEEVSRILTAYEKSVVTEETKDAIAQNKAAKRDESKRTSAGDLIMDMHEAGFFDKPKALADISSALEEKGFLYPTTSLSGIVLGPVKKHLLSRKKVEGRWVYGK
jgi:hypothetical protein